LVSSFRRSLSRCHCQAYLLGDSRLVPFNRAVLRIHLVVGSLLLFDQNGVLDCVDASENPW
jgi:hypothetical protein